MFVRTPLCELLGIEEPIAQAPIGTAVPGLDHTATPSTIQALIDRAPTMTPTPSDTNPPPAPTRGHSWCYPLGRARGSGRSPGHSGGRVRLGGSGLLRPPRDTYSGAARAWRRAAFHNPAALGWDRCNFPGHAAVAS
jgi:hypothetical protein